jgi:hypothetical protein
MGDTVSLTLLVAFALRLRRSWRWGIRGVGWRCDGVLIEFELKYSTGAKIPVESNTVLAVCSGWRHVVNHVFRSNPSRADSEFSSIDSRETHAH